MDAPPVPRPPLRERSAGERSAGQRTAGQWSDVVSAFVRRAPETGVASGGHHNRNHVLPLPEAVARAVSGEAGAQVLVRVRRPDALPVVLRTWEREAAILDAVQQTVPLAPKCLVSGPGFAIHSYVDGVPLSQLCENGKPVSGPVIKALAGLMAQVAQVRREALPSSLPRNVKDGQSFLRMLAHRADRDIRQSNWADYGGLFVALGVSADALIRWAERVPVMARRPYGLLHADLHRDNVIVTCHNDPSSSLASVDWELATYGDPLHDLAIHLVRMKYPDFQWDEVVNAWAEAMRATRPAAVNGLRRDLPHYVAFERAQSVFPDVMRAARSLEESFDQTSLDRATAAVREALAGAAEPLGLADVPGDAVIERILYRWRMSSSRRDVGPRTPIGWEPDPRVPEHPDFPRAAVPHALRAEGAAPANRVFKGTTHLNSVVLVEGVDFPVVVRRKVAEVCRREHSFLSEHAVLRAIERSKAEVAVPRVLALGTGYRDEPFAVHTYAGRWDIDQAPGHPVHGLLPREADALVDQLRALTGVKYKELDPMAGGGRFYSWLSEQLVLLVGDLPGESRQLARSLGLPDAARLREILSRHVVSDREPALLHGDLNPWNLVRRDDSMALTIIDWEMAVVGDPLYDLVRHMHLTPTRSEIRDRMFRRWESVLEPRFTHDWRQDWRVYRDIEIVRSAYIDLDRLVTGAGLEAPNVRRAVDSYPMTLASATAALGLPARSTENPYLALALR
ncbi:phosphotransferase family protein [Streptomyces geranii]|uniref:phosphotransferase family protein n=1 Tax=Streptomyces geranii TaxID=2058923 RepID=UPI000D042056|nr:aminoglycoside phosphotransferase family protein [Streptomyces geranii]